MPRLVLAGRVRLPLIVLSFVAVLSLGAVTSSTAPAVVTGAACYASWGLTNVTVAPAQPKTCPAGQQPVTWTTGAAQPPPAAALPVICNTCIFDSAKNLAGRNFSGVILTRSSFNATDLRGASFDGVTAWYVSFTFADLRGARLVGADLHYANFFRADLSNADLTNADLEGANLLGATMAGSILTGVNWNDSTCPDGSRATGTPPTCIGHLNP